MYSVLEYLSLIKRKGLISKSYLLIGDNTAVVSEIINLLACQQEDFPCHRCWDCQSLSKLNHPDFFVVNPQPNTIRIEEIREAQNFLFLKPYRLKKKILLVNGGDSFGLPAANAFLKTLEEPPKSSLIVISASKLEGILPTIISRCHKLFLPYQENREERLPQAVGLFLKGDKVSFANRKDFSEFLWGLLLVFHNQLLFQATGEKRLLKNEPCEIILRPYSLKDLEKILEIIFKVFSGYQNINENLALNMINLAL
ncbi:MAG: hypothetical protein PHV17_05255 [Candidatus Omnitrophica bacterium]|nr:hypothetical protein [Candidatus Omnitrophota bacterium]